MKSGMNLSHFIMFLFGCIFGAFLESFFAKGTLQEEREACDAEKLEAGELLFECASALEEKSKLCTETAKAAFERGNLLFQCEQTVCKASGWTPPPTYEEDLMNLEQARNGARKAIDREEGE